MVSHEAPGPPLRVVRFGADEPLPARRTLRAGPLTAVLEGGDLRYVAVGGREVVRRLYVAVRDRDWGTVGPVYTAYRVDQDERGFAVRFTAEHQRGDVHFVWDGRIEGTSDGAVTYTMDGEARTTFLRNRIGFCVLHPMALAGTPVTVETPAGMVRGAFPDRIAPHQPFVEMVAITHPTADGGSLAIRFAGDLFEMEDQRNWTDASYKTYGTPLRLPYPVEVRARQRVSQRVTLEVRGGTRTATAAAPEPGPRLDVGTETVGTLPAIGLGLASHPLPLTEAETANLRALRPCHLRVDLDLADAGWEERLRRGAREAGALGAAVQLEVVAGDAGEGLDRLIAAVAETGGGGRGADGAPVAALLVFPRTGFASTEPVLRRVRDLAARAGMVVPIGGGSRANFTELNRAAPPLDLMDLVGFPITPQVHAFDTASLVENIAAQATAVASARAIAGDRPLHVGPITLRPPFNPNATGPQPDPDPTELPSPVDPRHLSLLGAGWTVGSLRAVAEAGVASMTFYETTGWRGVLERGANLTRHHLFPSRPSQLFPLFHVLADASEFLGADLLPVRVSDPLAVDALALRDGDRLRVLVASFRDEPMDVALTLPPFDRGALRLLDETTYEGATTDGAAFRGRVDQEVDGASGRVTIALRPFAVARLDGRHRS